MACSFTDKWRKAKIVNEGTSQVDDELWLKLEPEIAKLLESIAATLDEDKSHDEQAARRATLRGLYEAYRSSLAPKAAILTPLYADFALMPSVRALWEPADAVLDDAAWTAARDGVEEDINEWRVSLRLYALQQIFQDFFEIADHVELAADADEYNDWGDPYFDSFLHSFVCSIQGCYVPGKSKDGGRPTFFGPLTVVLEHQHNMHADLAPSTALLKNPAAEPPFRIGLPLEFSVGLDALADIIAGHRNDQIRLQSGRHAALIDPEELTVEDVDDYFEADCSRVLQWWNVPLSEEMAQRLRSKGHRDVERDDLGWWTKPGPKEREWRNVVRSNYLSAGSDLSSPWISLAALPHLARNGEGAQSEGALLSYRADAVALLRLGRGSEGNRMDGCMRAGLLQEGARRVVAFFACVDDLHSIAFPVCFPNSARAEMMLSSRRKATRPAAGSNLLSMAPDALSACCEAATSALIAQWTQVRGITHVHKLLLLLRDLSALLVHSLVQFPLVLRKVLVFGLEVDLLLLGCASEETSSAGSSQHQPSTARQWGVESSRDAQSLRKKAFLPSLRLSASSFFHLRIASSCKSLFFLVTSRFSILLSDSSIRSLSSCGNWRFFLAAAAVFRIVSSSCWCCSARNEYDFRNKSLLTLPDRTSNRGSRAFSSCVSTTWRFRLTGRRALISVGLPGVEMSVYRTSSCCTP